jgi:hypothetical protein
VWSPTDRRRADRGKTLSSADATFSRFGGAVVSLALGRSQGHQDV